VKARKSFIISCTNTFERTVEPRWTLVGVSRSQPAKPCMVSVVKTRLSRLGSPKKRWNALKVSSYFLMVLMLRPKAS